MCNIAQAVNVLQSLLFTDGPEVKNCIRTTTYYAFALFKTHRGKFPSASKPRTLRRSSVGFRFQIAE